MTTWIGAAALRGGKGYASCPLGAMHYRRLSPSTMGVAPRASILLLHQTPFSCTEWAGVQPRLADLGFDVVAPDNPGYGMSDAPPGEVTVAELADNLLALLGQLEIDRIVVAGHHTGAAVAAAFAARHPARTQAVVLHGCPLYTAAERMERLARLAPSIEPRPDGSHLGELFRAIHERSGAAPGALVASTWATLGAALAGANTPVYRAVFANDMSLDLAAIRTPALLLSDGAETLHAKDRQVARRYPQFEYEEFSPGGSFSLMMEPVRWADRVARFVAECGA